MKKIVEFVPKVILGFLLILLGICTFVIIAIPIVFLVERALSIFVLISIAVVLRISWVIGSIMVEIIKRAKKGCECERNRDTEI